MAASSVSTPWNTKGTSPVDDQTSTFSTVEYPPFPTRVVDMEIDPVTLRPAAKTRSEHAASSQARARLPTAFPAITSETPPANLYERPGRQIVVNESANTTYSPEQKAWDGWDSDLDRGSDEDQEGAYRKGLQGNLHRLEEYEMESMKNTLEDPIMRAHAVESRRLAKGHGKTGDNTDDWLSPLNTSATAMGDRLTPVGTLDTSVGSSQKEGSETEYRQPFAEVIDQPLVSRFLHSQA